MFRSILVPLDGSRFAEGSLPTAVQLAREARAGIHVVLAHEPIPVMVGAELVPPPGDLDGGRREREHAYLAETTAELSKGLNGPVEAHEIEGKAGPAICEEATRLGADLVVMATHGRGAFGRLWLGGVADYLMRHLSIPVLLLNPRKKGLAPVEAKLANILVALDLSEEGEAILGPVRALAGLAQAQVTLIHVVQQGYVMGNVSVPSPVARDTAILEAARDEAQRHLDAIADRLRQQGLSVSTRVTIGINAASGLLDALDESRFDLIALTTHGAGGMRRLLTGSVADKVVRVASKPVLVLRPPHEG